MDGLDQIIAQTLTRDARRKHRGMLGVGRGVVSFSVCACLYLAQGFEMFSQGL